MALVDAYTKEIYKQRDTYAAYPFGEQIEIGFFGRLDGKNFTYEGDLAAQNWFSSPPDGIPTSKGSTADTISLSTSGEVKVTFKREGETTSAGTGVIPKASSGFIIEFGQKHSMILECQGVTNHAIKYLSAVGGKIIERYKEGKWPKDRVLVTQIWQAESTFVAVSKSSDIAAEYELKGTVEDEGSNELASAAINLQLRSSSSAVEWASFSTRWNPYFVLHQIKHPPLGSVSFEQI